jgi:formate dehydrogenase major subunit
MCVVEVEKNPKLLTSCTTPAQDGMVVHTTTEKLFQLRSRCWNFSSPGRNHFCMYCSQSGDCELQRQVHRTRYGFGRYPYLYADFSNDGRTGDSVGITTVASLSSLHPHLRGEGGVPTPGSSEAGLECHGGGRSGKEARRERYLRELWCLCSGLPYGNHHAPGVRLSRQTEQCDDAVESVCPLAPWGGRFKAYVRTAASPAWKGSARKSPTEGSSATRDAGGSPSPRNGIA